MVVVVVVVVVAGVVLLLLLLLFAFGDQSVTNAVQQLLSAVHYRTQVNNRTPHSLFLFVTTAIQAIFHT